MFDFITKAVETIKLTYDYFVGFIFGMSEERAQRIITRTDAGLEPMIFTATWIVTFTIGVVAGALLGEIGSMIVMLAFGFKLLTGMEGSFEVITKVDRDGVTEVSDAASMETATA